MYRGPNIRCLRRSVCPQAVLGIGLGGVRPVVHGVRVISPRNFDDEIVKEIPMDVSGSKKKILLL